MAKRINIKGRITGDGNAWIYDWLEIPYTSPKRVIKELDKANGEDIEVYINSGGGSVYDGYEIYNALAEYKGNVTVKIIGLAASAASFISMIPNAKCYMSPLSEMMIHNSSTYAGGPHQVMDATSNMLQVTDTTIAQAYVLKSGRNENEIKEFMEKESWFTAQQAKELGLIDGILFDMQTENNPVPTLYNALPLNDDALISELEKCKTVDELKAKFTENIDKMFKKDLGHQPTILNTLGINKNNEEDEKMDLGKLKANHIDLYNQVVENATKEERVRINEINELAMPGLENVIKEGIENGYTAEKVAMNIIKAQKEIGNTYLENVADDAKKSNINNVQTTAAPQNTETKEENKQNAVNLLVSAAKTLTGGKV